MGNCASSPKDGAPSTHEEPSIKLGVRHVHHGSANGAVLRQCSREGAALLLRPSLTPPSPCSATTSPSAAASCEPLRRRSSASPCSTPLPLTKLHPPSIRRGSLPPSPGAPLSPTLKAPPSTLQDSTTPTPRAAFPRDSARNAFPRDSAFSVARGSLPPRQSCPQSPLEPLLHTRLASFNPEHRAPSFSTATAATGSPPALRMPVPHPFLLTSPKSASAPRPRASLQSHTHALTKSFSETGPAGMGGQYHTAPCVLGAVGTIRSSAWAQPVESAGLGSCGLQARDSWVSLSPSLPSLPQLVLPPSPRLSQPTAATAARATPAGACSSPGVQADTPAGGAGVQGSRCAPLQQAPQGRERHRSSSCAVLGAGAPGGEAARAAGGFKQTSEGSFHMGMPSGLLTKELPLQELPPSARLCLEDWMSMHIAMEVAREAGEHVPQLCAAEEAACLDVELQDGFAGLRGEAPATPGCTAPGRATSGAHLKRIASTGSYAGAPRTSLAALARSRSSSASGATFCVPPASGSCGDRASGEQAPRLSCRASSLGAPSSLPGSSSWRQSHTGSTRTTPGSRNSNSLSGQASSGSALQAMHTGAPQISQSSDSMASLAAEAMAALTRPFLKRLSSKRSSYSELSSFPGKAPVGVCTLDVLDTKPWTKPPPTVRAPTAAIPQPQHHTLPPKAPSLPTLLLPSFPLKSTPINTPTKTSPAGGGGGSSGGGSPWGLRDGSASQVLLETRNSAHSSTPGADGGDSGGGSPHPLSAPAHGRSWRGPHTIDPTVQLSSPFTNTGTASSMCSWRASPPPGSLTRSRSSPNNPFPALILRPPASEWQQQQQQQQQQQRGHVGAHTHLLGQWGGGVQGMERAAHAAHARRLSAGTAGSPQAVRLLPLPTNQAQGLQASPLSTSLPFGNSAPPTPVRDDHERLALQGFFSPRLLARNGHGSTCNLLLDKVSESTGGESPDTSLPSSSERMSDL